MAIPRYGVGPAIINFMPVSWIPCSGEGDVGLFASAAQLFGIEGGSPRARHGRLIDHTAC